MSLLIDKDDILKYREIARSVRDEKINPFIQDAELLDLRKMIGESLYRDLKVNFQDQKYELLWKGGNYTHNGETYSFQGLEIVLCLLAYARYMMFGSVTDTPFGLVEKSFQDSTPVPAITKKTLYTENRRAAGEYFQDVKLFLNRKKGDYPVDRNICRGGNSSFRISKIS